MSNQRREEDEINNQLRIYRGVIPWSVAEHDRVVAAFDERILKNENLPLPEEFAEFKDDFKTLKGDELQNLKNMILFSDIFHKRYPKELEYEAHFYRFQQINKFLQTHHDELVELNLVSVQGKHYVDPQLMEALCTMLYDEEDFDESGEWIGNTFSFKDAVSKTKAKINKKTGKKPLNEDQGFKGLIPWSTKEFYWAFAEQRKNKLGSISSFEDVAALGEIFQKRYPDSLTFKAHMLRFHMIKTFLYKNAAQLMKDGFGAVEGEAGFRNELMDVLCTLPYSLEETDKNGEKGYKFLYSQVKNEALKRINAHLN